MRPFIIPVLDWGIDTALKNSKEVPGFRAFSVLPKAEGSMVDLIKDKDYSAQKGVLANPWQPLVLELIILACNAHKT